MSVELPEARILAEQMNKELRGKRVRSYRLQNYEKLQRLGFVNKDTRYFDRLVNARIEFVTHRGTVIRVKFDNNMSLILAPEYGGIVLFHTSEKTVLSKFHLKIDFSDNTVLTVRLTGMGVIHAVRDNELQQSYVYRRDFSEVLSPSDDKRFTLEGFSKLLTDTDMMLKSVLVGKDAIIVGLGNSAFQDILYRARIHPKRRASELSKDERRALYDATKLLVEERIRLGGKSQFTDLYGNQGRYTPAMGPNLNQQNCPECGRRVEKLSIGGGQTYYCPQCQR